MPEAFSAGKRGIRISFVVNGMLLPSGDYSIQRNTEGESQKLMIQRVGGSPWQLISTNPVHRLVSSSLRVIFNQYGGVHFLSQIWAEGSDSGYELTKTEAEVEFARKAKLSNDAEQLHVVSIPAR
jgi:hypothetical protein